MKPAKSIPSSLSKPPSATIEEIGNYIYRLFQKASSLRATATVENRWESNYALYRASKEDMKKSYQDSFAVGSKREWNHRVNTGKCFEVVETLVAYFKGATFPSDDWFDVAGLEPNLRQASMLVKALAKYKMEEAGVRDAVEQWVRNVLIYGVATYKVGWSDSLTRKFERTFDAAGLPDDKTRNEEKSELYFCTPNPHDVWLTTDKETSKAGIFVNLRLSKEEIKERIDEGYYNLDPRLLDQYEDSENYDPNISKTYNSGVDKEQIVEYYGSFSYEGAQFWCVHAVFYRNVLIRLADSEYWAGSPYVTATLIPDRDSPYGLSVIDPSSGSLHVLNVLTNSRLDNIAVSIDKMFTYVDDGLLKQEDIYTQPGKIFKVASHDSLRPIELGNQNFVVTYQEAQLQERAIDSVAATGALIGTGAPRSGERVTASEIKAVQDAGGNRLSSYHAHIEDTATLRLLKKVFSILQQYVITPQTVKVYLPESDTAAFFELHPDFLHYPYDLKPSGASYVVEKQRALSDILQLFELAGRVPQIAEMLDFNKILTELLKQMRFTNPESFLKSSAPAPGAPEQQLPADPSQATPVQPTNIESQALAQQLQADGGQSLLGSIGVNTEGVDPETTAQLLTQASTGA